MPDVPPVSLGETDFSRRLFLSLAAAAGAAAGRTMPFSVFAQAGEEELPVTGVAQADLEPFDRLMASFVEEHNVPGAALAVTQRGRLVYARGFGFADVEQKQPVQPASLFRIASISKPLTAVAIMQLVERNKLQLDDSVLPLMQLEPLLPAGSTPDSRWEQITIPQCLQHTGGWDRSITPDPIGRAWEIAAALGIQPPVTPAHIVRYMMGQPLDFDPGERYAYSNLGYLILGRIIEAVTGQTYEAHVKQMVARPLGIRTLQLGRALMENRAEGEVRYYDSEQRTGKSLYPPLVGQEVPRPYGGDNLEAYEAHGGWIASVVDLVRFAAAFDDPARCPLLGAAAIREMWTPPEGAAGHEDDGSPKAVYYGCGWNVRPVGTTGKSNNWHAGFIPGSESLLVRRWDGLNWAVLFNTHRNHTGKSLASQIDGRLHEAADQVKAWPETDQFDRFLK
ncbi:MAG: beta-lactamase family protein [Planctomycetaceae bacterium]|nr:beta-lactamase family protein [Planctomycetaceae bacterium]